MTRCENCEEIIKVDNTDTVVSSRGVYCNVDCWEADYGYEWPFSS